VSSYIDEIKFFKIPLHCLHYLPSPLQGLCYHGGYSWTEQRLTGIWNALFDALHSGTAGLEVRT
jgi:hypothetical protein